MTCASLNTREHDIMAAREQRLTENSRKRTRQNGVSREDVPNEKQEAKAGKRKKADLSQQHSDGNQMQELDVENVCVLSGEHAIIEEQGFELGFGLKDSISTTIENDTSKKQKDELRQMVQKVLRDGAKPGNPLADRQVTRKT